jgi:hypothetical protein
MWNYDLDRDLKLQEPFNKFCDIVEEAFGTSKQVGWWLESDLNRNPYHLCVSGLLPALLLSVAYTDRRSVQWSNYTPEWIEGWERSGYTAENVGKHEEGQGQDGLTYNE